MKTIFISFAIAASTVPLIGCADVPEAKTSQSSVPASQSRYIVRSTAGEAYSDVDVLQIWNQNAAIILNKKSGNILSFTNSGVRAQITRTFYESADCSGQAMALPGAEPNIKNKLFANSGAKPPSIPALRVTGFFLASKTFQSIFEAGVCGPYAASASGGVYLVPAEFDSSDPVSIEVPVEVNLEVGA